ncbi:MAG: 30S ribosomal protein S20 [Clostridiales bacterium]|nr:30S ribosomal protein S20 [Clostridiales bacterium]
MANIKSAKKRVLIAEMRRQRNMAEKSRMKTQLKKFTEAVSSGDKSSAQGQLAASVRILDKVASKGIIHKNTAARRKANLYKVFNQMSVAE